MSTEIEASTARVWRALCDPAEVVVRDTGVEKAIDAPDDYPQPGQHVRWQYSSGPFRILNDRPQEVVSEQRLRSLLGVGPFRFDEAYTLEANDDGCKLTARMDVSVALPGLGWLIERLYIGPATKRTVGASLAAIKRHCEALDKLRMGEA
ncbi:MAG: hypothetical protein IH865_09160 [Chloroflexi bacterium]|nr:hypothetical protein [Chloroflexota bacterium]